jgi:hypothetical protein
VVPYFAKNDIKGACNKLIDDSTLMWKAEEDSIDDITCLIIFIRQERE